MTWGKVDPDSLPDSVTCYTDSTIALPLLTAYSLARHAPRPLRRLYDRRITDYDGLRTDFQARGEKPPDPSAQKSSIERSRPPGEDPSDSG